MFGEATQFVVPGKPVPKGRPRMGPNGNVYTPKETEAYEEKVGWYGRAAGLKPLKKPKRVVVQLAFHLRNVMVGDADNFCKSVLDGLNGVAYEDDCQVTMLKVIKVQSKDPRVSIIIQEIL